MNQPIPLPLHVSIPDCAASLRLSVIVPFAPHETEGAALLEQLCGLPYDTEVMLVRADGASWPRALRENGNDAVGRVLISPSGRARQMNVGAQTARGRWLWFLHADSRLCPHTLPALRAFLDQDDAALGFFDLRYRNDGPTLARLNALGANLRARWLGLPFGDQGFVLPAAWFERLGGYDESADYGEDHLLVWRARAAGLPLRRIAAPLGSSARKYAECGWWHTTTRHLRLTAHQAWPRWRALRHAREARTP